MSQEQSPIYRRRDSGRKGGLSKDNLDTRTLFVRCDLRDIADVNRVADHPLTKPDRLNILINDAGRPECAVLVVLAET